MVLLGSSYLHVARTPTPTHAAYASRSHAFLSVRCLTARSPRPPHAMRTGKSTIAQQLASRLNMPNVLQTDVVCEVRGKGVPACQG